MKKSLTVVVALVASLIAVAAPSSAQTASNIETKAFNLGRIGVYPYFATCMSARQTTTGTSACQTLGYEDAVTVTNIQCVHSGDNWSLTFTGTCKRTRNTTPN